MKQLLILGKNLVIKQILTVDNIIPIQDIISPQKTIFQVPLNRELLIGDLVILKDSSDFEYFGIIQDLEIDEITTIASYPLINITDGEYQLTTLNGNVYDWIVDTFKKNFVDIDDDLLKMPLSFINNAGSVSLYLDLTDGNLFDALLTIFKKTGIYIRFSLKYENKRAVNIVCNVEKADNNSKITIRYDNPIVFERPIIELSNSQSINKVIFKPNDNLAGTTIYTFYLLDDNTVTTNANATGRINGVVQTIQTYPASENNVDILKQRAEELMLGDTLNHQITLKVVNNESFNFKLYDRVEYVDEKTKDGRNRAFETYVTRIENINNVYKVLKLGILRTTLTDKIKALEKSISNQTVSGGSSGGSGGAVSSVNGKTGVVVLGASDVNALPSSTKYGAEIELIIDSSTYVVTAQLKDQNGNVLSTSKNIDLPLETMVVNGSYDSATKEVILTLDNGNTVKFSVADLVSGLQNEITATNKLASDLVDDTDQNNKFMTADEKSKLSGIQAGAQKNPTNYVTTNTAQTITSEKSFNISQNIYIQDRWDSLSAGIIPSSKLDNDDASATNNVVRPVLKLNSKILENNTVTHISVVQKFQDKNGTIALTDDIPAEYLKSASVSDDTLTITKQDGSRMLFKGGGGTEYTAGAGIGISNGVISSLIKGVLSRKLASEQAISGSYVDLIFGTNLFTYGNVSYNSSNQIVIGKDIVAIKLTITTAFYNMSKEGYATIRIYKNGANIGEELWFSYQSGISGGGANSIIIPCSEGDTFVLKLKATSGHTGYVNNNTFVVAEVM